MHMCIFTCESTWLAIGMLRPWPVGALTAPWWWQHKLWCYLVSVGHESTGFAARPSGCSFPSSLTSSMTLGKLHQLFEPPFSLLQNRGNNHSHLKGWL